MAMQIRRKPVSRLLNPATGFLTGYSHTLNPYAGCAFACSYCYVRRMPVALFRGEPWGTWVDVKENAGQALTGELKRAKRKGAVTIFMSSSTDPYQPEEYKHGITRSLLEAMIAEPPDFLFVQTRSPLVTRDIDLLVRMKDRVRVSMTTETDLEPIRKLFAPAAPPIAGRLQALKQLTAAGIPVQATIAPLLPCSERFAATLAAIVPRVCLDDYFMGDGSGGKRTEAIGIPAIYREHGLETWYGRESFKKVLEQLQRHFSSDSIFVSKEGFMPG